MFGLNYYVQRYLPDTQSRGYAALFATLLWVAILGFAVAFPAYRGIFLVRGSLDTAQQRENTLARKVESIEQAKRVYAEQERNRALLDEAVPDNPHVVTFVNDVNLALDNFNLQKEVFTYSGENILGEGYQNNKPEQPKIFALTFNLNVAGTYNDISNFLTRLESLPRVVQIQTFQVEEANIAEEDDSQPLRLIVSGEVYFQDEK